MGPEQLTVVAMSWSRVFWKAEAVKLWLGAQVIILFANYVASRDLCKNLVY